MQDGGFQRISAVTLATRHMGRALAFYEALGFFCDSGGPQASFSTCRAGDTVVNLTAERPFEPCWWGRVIFHVADVDRVYERALAAGLAPHAAPADARWGERYFHITDPDGHELSIAAPLRPNA